MQTEQKRETRETPQIQAERDKKKGSAVITPNLRPSFGFGFTLAVIFLLGNLLIAAIYFQVINP